MGGGGGSPFSGWGGVHSDVMPGSKGGGNVPLVVCDVPYAAASRVEAE